MVDSATCLTCTPPTNVSGNNFQASINCSDCSGFKVAAKGRSATSSRITLCPASAKSLASSQPTKPAPTTATRCGVCPKAARNCAYTRRWLMRQHSAVGNCGSDRASAPCASTRCSYRSVPRLVRSCRLAGVTRTACVWASSLTLSRCAASMPVSRGSLSTAMPRAMATDSRGLSYTSPLQAVTSVIGMALSPARNVCAICQPARPAPTITVPGLRLVRGALLAEERACRTGSSTYSSKSDLVTPHSGQAQSPGMSAKRVPAARPLSSSPLLSS